MRLFIASAALAVALLASLPAQAEDAPHLSSGQMIYVPAYSQISHGNMDGKGQPLTVLLSTTLSLRNTDPSETITVTSVKYYDTDGRVVRQFVTAPVTLEAMASKDFFVEHRDTTGGNGANFVVEWTSAKPVNIPLAETINAYFFGTQSMAFIGQGRAILPPAKDGR